MKIVVFDCDGVLINSKDKSGNFLWQKNIEKDLGLTSDKVNRIYSGDWLQVLKGLMDTWQYFKSVFTELNIALSVDLFIEYWLNHDSNINKEILSVIKLISGHKLCIGTNQDSIRAMFVKKMFGAYFEEIFCSCKIGAIKPEAEFFRHIELKLNVESKDIFFIDDSKSHIEAAAQLGWTCHHYQNVEAFKKFIVASRIPHVF